MSLRIDHVLYAASDLEATSARLADEHGLASIPGGEHPAWGTANRIVQLGPDYLELVGVVDADTAASSDFGRLLLGAGEGLIGWAVATDDVAAAAARCGLAVERGSRTRPDGVELAWRLAGVTEAMRSGGALPVFIQWEGPAELHPGGDPSAAAGIDWVQVGGDPAELREWLGGAELRVRFAPEASGITAAGIRGSSVV